MISQYFTLTWREVRALLVSPVAWAAAALSTVVMGLYFVSSISSLTEARLEPWFESVGVVLLFLAPVLTMRSIAEEQRSGSLDILRAGPVADGVIVAGKFSGIVVVYTGILAATAPAPVFLEIWSDLDTGPVLTGYLGLYLLGLASIAVGLLASALSSHQAVAAVVGFVLLLVLWLLQGLADVFAGSAAELMVRLGSTTRLAAFGRGLLRLESIVYYLGVVVVALVACAQTIGIRSDR